MKPDEQHTNIEVGQIVSAYRVQCANCGMLLEVWSQSPTSFLMNRGWRLATLDKQGATRFKRGWVCNECEPTAEG